MLETNLERITPEHAALLLKDHANYRRLNEQRVLAIMRDIINGAWEINGESIKLDKQGRLIDGQHRLEAVRRSGIAIDTFVVWGVSENAVLDVGKPRTTAQWLSSIAVPNASASAAGLTRVVAFLLSDERRSWADKRLFQLITRHDTQLVFDELGVEAIVESTQCAIRGDRIVYPSDCCGLLMIAELGDFVPMATEFVQQVHTPSIDDIAKTPAQLLRARFVRYRNEGTRPGQTVAWALFAKAWNKTAQGQTIDRLGFYPGKGEQLPILELPEGSDIERLNSLRSKLLKGKSNG